MAQSQPLPFDHSRIPDEILSNIFDSCAPRPRLRPAAGDFINNLKLVLDDCELAAEIELRHSFRIRASRVCRRWRSILLDDPSQSIAILGADTTNIPNARRVHFPAQDAVNSCECGVNGCLMAHPPFVHPIACHTHHALEELVDVHAHRPEWMIPLPPNCAGLRLLAIDRRETSATFSMPTLSTSYPNLTHLHLSPFILRPSNEDQTLNLPSLILLSLEFVIKRTDGSGHHTGPIHPSFRNWKLPALRHLALRGMLRGEHRRSFFEDIDAFLQSVGRTVEGLLYKFCVQGPNGEEFEPLPNQLGEFCPNLLTIYTFLKSFYSTPSPPSSKSIMVVPICITNLDQTIEYTSFMWTAEHFEEIHRVRPWAIRGVRLPTSLETFHRKLKRIHEEQAGLISGGSHNLITTDWAGYFGKWIGVLISGGYAIEDRYGVDLNTHRQHQLMVWLGRLNALPELPTSPTSPSVGSTESHMTGSGEEHGSADSHLMIYEH